MEVIKTILIIIYSIISIALIILALTQSKGDEGASAAVVGSSSSFYEKNKGRTKEGILKKWTIILGITFVILTIIVGIVYMM